ANARSAYVFSDDNLGAARLALALEREGFKLAVALAPLVADGKTWPRGTFIARLQRNPAALADRITALAPPLGVAVTAVQGGFGGAGLFAAHKDVGLSTIAAVGDSGKPDTTVKANAPPLPSPGAATRDKPEALPGTICRATLDRTHWLTLGYEQNQLPVYLEGDTFWRQSKNGANPLVFTGDSLTLSGFTWPDNTERLLKGTAWAVVENQGDGHVILFLGDPLFRAFWRGPARLVTNAILLGPNRR